MGNQLQPWQQRVRRERNSLEKNVAKLWIFITTQNFKQLDPKDQSLLQEQFKHMMDYLLVLNERIERFNV